MLFRFVLENLRLKQLLLASFAVVLSSAALADDQRPSSPDPATDPATQLSETQRQAIIAAMDIPAMDLSIHVKKIPKKKVEEVKASLPKPEYEYRCLIDKKNPNQVHVVVVNPDTNSVVMNSQGLMADRVVPVSSCKDIALVHNSKEMDAANGKWRLFIGSLGEALLSSLSVDFGETVVQRDQPSVWWQPGLENEMQLIKPSGEVELDVKASSFSFLSQLPVINRSSLNFSYHYYGILPFKTNAKATGSGYSNPADNPVYQWTGEGHAKAFCAALQEELPFGFYVGAGLCQEKNVWKMTVHQASCSGGLNCPPIGPFSVYDGIKPSLSEYFYIGKKVIEHVDVKLEGNNLSDGPWSANPYAIPAGWHNFSWTLGLRIHR